MKTLSLVIALYNQLEFTRRCIASIKQYTPGPFELILINNGCVDGTAEYLEGLDATVVTNERNLGCAKAWNQGIRASHGEVVGILNNDILVTPQWSDALLAFMERESHGIVCPSAREGLLDYDLTAYARAFTHTCAEAVREDLYAPCMFIDRAVFDRIGLFDEAFTYGGCEDTDFFWRTKAARFSVAMTGSVLIHHYSKVTQDAVTRTETDDYWNNNMAHFQKKWGRTIRGNWFQRRWTDWHAKWVKRSEQRRFGHTLVEKLVPSLELPPSFD
ncbi:MAG TPA: glycosyltransferase family 2 protein [Nitrospira sp.]|nr:glycosyltransferase family 2 protein [Nitrospira sp. NTP1]HQR15104.1 glycosyltransferase family 2 protein [Nitrospira sp.]